MLKKKTVQMMLDKAWQGRLYSREDYLIGLGATGMELHSAGRLGFAQSQHSLGKWELRAREQGGGQRMEKYWGEMSGVRGFWVSWRNKGPAGVRPGWADISWGWWGMRELIRYGGWGIRIKLTYQGSWLSWTMQKMNTDTKSQAQWVTFRGVWEEFGQRENLYWW